jgi:hypothetical protein
MKEHDEEIKKLISQVDQLNFRVKEITKKALSEQEKSQKTQEVIQELQEVTGIAHRKEIEELKNQNPHYMNTTQL